MPSACVIQMEIIKSANFYYFLYAVCLFFGFALFMALNF